MLVLVEGRAYGHTYSMFSNGLNQNKTDHGWSLSVEGLMLMAMKVQPGGQR